MAKAAPAAKAAPPAAEEVTRQRPRAVVPRAAGGASDALLVPPAQARALSGPARRTPRLPRVPAPPPPSDSDGGAGGGGGGSLVLFGPHEGDLDCATLAHIQHRTLPLRDACLGVR